MYSNYSRLQSSQCWHMLCNNTKISWQGGYVNLQTKQCRCVCTRRKKDIVELILVQWAKLMFLHLSTNEWVFMFLRPLDWWWWCSIHRTGYRYQHSTGIEGFANCPLCKIPVSTTPKQYFWTVTVDHWHINPNACAGILLAVLWIKTTFPRCFILEFYRDNNKAIPISSRLLVHHGLFQSPE